MNQGFTEAVGNLVWWVRVVFVMKILHLRKNYQQNSLLFSRIQELALVAGWSREKF